MNRTVAFACLSLLAAAPALAQAPAAPAAAPARPPPVCKPAEQEVAPGSIGRPAPAAPPPRTVSITAIPGVVAAGGSWTKLWQQGGNSADGLVPDKDGNVLFAQEDYDGALKLTPGGKVSVAVTGYGGLSSLSMDRQGRLYGLSRTERVGSAKPNKDAIVNSIALLAPERRIIADKWTDGTPLTIRPNDLFADSHGGAYFTIGCLYYADPKGASVVAENLRTNGVEMSLDDHVLYVTNGRELVAFDVTAPGVLANRRHFADLQAGGAGDGMAIDSEGRLYVSSGPGVQVFDKTGAYLGLIPTPQGIISVAFAGPGKRTLFAIVESAQDAAGQPIRQGPQQTAASIYSLPMLAQGPSGRAK